MVFTFKTQVGSMGSTTNRFGTRYAGCLTGKAMRDPGHQLCIPRMGEHCPTCEAAHVAGIKQAPEPRRPYWIFDKAIWNRV